MSTSYNVAGDGRHDASRPPRVCFVTVDPSGDAIGAAVAEALTRRGGIELYGVGGPAMRRAGVKLLREATNWSALGCVGWAYVYWSAALGNYWLRWKIARLKPDLLVLIDCGGFNVPLARTLKWLCKQKVLYYIPPRSWSRKWRVGRLAKVVDYIAAPFPWNLEGDDGTGRVRFVGHPAVDLPAQLPPRDKLRQQLGLSQEALVLGLLPGSRRLEIKVHLPLLLATAKLLRGEFPGLEFVLSRALTVKSSTVEQHLRRAGLEGITVTEGAGRALRAADVALVCLGTATLEGAVLGCPMVGFYRGTWLQSLEYRIKPPKTRFYAMPNIIVGDQVLLEVIQDAATPERLAREAASLLRDSEARKRSAVQLRRVVEELGGEGAAERVAEAICDALTGHWHSSRHTASPDVSAHSPSEKRTAVS